MGYFLAATAFHTESVSDVAQAISEFMHSHGVTHEILSGATEPQEATDAPTELDRVAAFTPHPEALCSALGVPAGVIAPYLVDVDNLSDENAKAHAQDQFELADFWVFTDFWQKLGITYPDPPVNPGAVIRLSKWFSKRLPSA